MIASSQSGVYTKVPVLAQGLDREVLRFPLLYGGREVCGISLFERPI